jgi:hypothetical protein
MYLSANWKTETASLNDMRKNIDLSRITHLRLECGYTGESEKNTDSPVGLTVYFKTIQVIKGG